MNDYCGFKNTSYKELQLMAKQSRIPANMQRKVLVEALVAHRSGDVQLVDNIVNIYKSNRKRKMANKPQNLSMSKKKRTKNAKLRSNDETVVDSTSQEVREMVPFNCSVPPSNITFSNSEKCAPDLFASRMYVNPNQQYQCLSEFSQWNPLNIPNDTHFSGNNNAYGAYPMDFKVPVAASTPFDVSKYSLQNSSQYYQPDCNLVHYGCGESYRPNLYLQQTGHNCNSINTNENYNSELGHYHQSPTVSRNSSSVMPSANSSLASKNNFGNACSVSKNNYYAKDTINNVSRIEVAYPSPYLPNIPQLADVQAENVPSSNGSSSWSQEALVDNELGRPLFELSNRSPPRETSQSQNSHFKSILATNGNLSFDKYSDEETASFEDIANILEGNKIDSNKSNVVSSSDNGEVGWYTNGGFEHFYSMTGNQNVVEAVNGSKFPCPNMTVTCSQSGSSAQSAFGTNLNNFSFDNVTFTAPQTSLPPISTLFRAMNHNSVSSHSDSQHTSHKPIALDNRARTESIYTSFASENDNSWKEFYAEVDSKNRDHDCINLITPSASPVRNCSDGSTLRSRLLADLSSNLAVISTNKNQLTTETSNSSNQTIGKSVLSIHESLQKVKEDDATILSTPYSVMLQKSVQESKLNLGNVVLVKENSDCKKTEKKDTKTQVSQLIYESETLHRSKIICNVLKDDSLKGENLRSLVHFFEYAGIPKENCLDLKPMTVIKTLEKETLTKGTALAVIPVCHRSCMYRKRGCNTIARQELVHRHEKRCLFKPVLCPSDMCSWNDSVNMLNQHICEHHGDEIKTRNQYVYLVDRKKSNDQTFNTYYQIHKKTIYVIRLHTQDDRCIAAVQYIPEVDSVFRPEKTTNITMQMYAFCNKLKVKSWKGVVQPYCEGENQDQHGLIQLNVRNIEFIALRLVIG